MISFSKVFLVVGGSYIWLRYGHQLIASKVIRLISGGLIGSIILVANLNDLRLSQLLYAVLVILISLLWLKRHKFHFV